MAATPPNPFNDEKTRMAQQAGQLDGVAGLSTPDPIEETTEKNKRKDASRLFVATKLSREAEIERRIAKLEQELAETREEIDKNKQDLEDAFAQREALQVKITELREKLEQADDRESELQNKIKDVETAIDEINEKLSDTAMGLPQEAQDLLPSLHEAKPYIVVSPEFNDGTPDQNYMVFQDDNGGYFIETENGRVILSEDNPALNNWNEVLEDIEKQQGWGDAFANDNPDLAEDYRDAHKKFIETVGDNRDKFRGLSEKNSRFIKTHLAR